MTTALQMRGPATDVISVTLDDGRTVTLRPLDVADSAVLSAAIDHADPMDLRRRFMGVPPPTSVLLRRLAAADGVHDVVIGAFDERNRLVAVAQFDRVDDRPSAEFAVEVAGHYQRHGLALRMLEELEQMARSLGITRFTASYYADNLAVRRLIHRTGQVLESGFDHGEGYAVLDITRPMQAQGRTSR